MSKPLHRDAQNIQRPLEPQVRASAGRIVDIVQILVLDRPEMIIPLEEIVRGILTNLRISVLTNLSEPDDKRRLRRRADLPPAPLRELPAMWALIEPAAIDGTTRNRTVTKKRPRRR
jgi:hypothetical protein